MTKSFKPMLAPSDLPDFAMLRYPVVASPKLDGIRCVVHGGKALSRSLKPIPNVRIRELFDNARLNGLDGELMLKGGTFQETTSAVMSHDGDVQLLEWHVFDDSMHPGGFQQRYAGLAARVSGLLAGPEVRGRINVVPHTLIRDENDLHLYEQAKLTEGYEGIMLRDPDGPYKFGRSTLKEGWLLKVKRFEDAEAVVVGFEQLMVNENEAQTNELGRTKRSSAKAGLVPFPALGAFVLERSDGVRFNCGSGLNDDQKTEFWVRRAKLMGALVKYKHQPHGAKDAPRSPVFLGLRSKEDM